MAVAAPPCPALGPQCRALDLTLLVVDLTEDDAPVHDAMATWLLGHTERLTFDPPRVEGTRLVADAVLHVPCRFLQAGTRGSGRCGAHGYAGPVPAAPAPARPPAIGPAGTFRIVQDGEVRRLPLTARGRPARELPTLPSENPCEGAPCRTADNRRGAACCRDLTVDVVVPETDTTLEALLRTRHSPYLCKVTRTGPDLIESEIISACGYLEPSGVACVLHDRVRADGSPAKPGVCSDWPSLEPGSTWHPGCRLVPAGKTP